MHSKAPEVTRGPTPANHVGLNSRVINYTLNETASGSTTIAIAALPGGGRVQRAQVRANHAALNAGANAGAVRLYATIGGNNVGNLINTTTLSYSVHTGANGTLEPGLGVRLTSSANLILQVHDCVGTGTASTQFSITIDYLSDEMPD